MTAQTKQRGDRRDGVWLRDLDPLHGFTPYLMPNRADNEAFLNEQIDITALNEYLAQKTKADPEFKYTYLHAVVAALVKTVTLRPRMNRFISGNRIYQRNELSVAFVVKKGFSDDAHEALLCLRFNENDNINSIHDSIKKEVTTLRKQDVLDNSTDMMGTLLKLPRFVMALLIKVLFFLDKRGIVPYSLVKDDPNYATVFISNLGSIGLHAAYHHLNNWGTNSVFVVIGEKHKAPFYADDGSVELREVIDLGLTLDERIADGYYYSKTVKLLKYLLQNPTLLELPAKETVDYE